MFYHWMFYHWNLPLKKLLINLDKFPLTPFFFTLDNNTRCQNFCPQKIWKVHWKLVFRKFYCILHKRYCLFIILLIDWNNICLSSLGSKCTSSHKVLKDQSKWMRNRVSEKLNHSNQNIIMTMCFIYMPGLYYFDNI